ncbi:hypothetical protein JYU34_006371 [Plutella xylostella]|uniref:Gustatory receptor n=2 Tax=Plutella xylostella TaxID=51655 RepID=A0ABQ7QRU7_PLUXY|nr:hypothetical protein JYU34_006371 [Plutella xylostella]
MKLTTLTVSILYVYCFGRYLVVPYGDNDPRIYVFFLGKLPSVFMLMQCVAAAVSTAFLYSEANVRIVVDLARVDASLYLKNNHKMYVRHRRLAKFAVACLILGHIAYNANIYINQDSVIINCLLTWPVFVFHDEQYMFFGCIVSMIDGRLQIINENIEKIIKRKNDKTLVATLNFEEFPKKFEVRGLSLVYDMIARVVASINEAFNLSLLLSIITTFAFMVGTILTSLVYFRFAKGDKHSMGPLIMSVVWAIAGLSNIGMISYVCESLQKTRRKTMRLLNEIIMDYGFPGTARSEAKSFMELLNAWPLQMSIYHMATIDTSLVLKVMSASTTYLIVIVQMSHIFE